MHKPVFDPSLDLTQNGQRPIAQLTLVSGPGSGQRFNVEDGVTIGRSPDTQIVIDHEDVSRAHARIWKGAKDAFYLEDLGSRNGTFVDDVRIDRRALSYGNRIRLGSEVTFEFSQALALSHQLTQKHRFEMLGRIGVGAAHDVHNLISAVSATAGSLKEMLSERGLSDRGVLECVSDLLLASARASQFAAAMMDFARAGRGERSVVDLSTLVLEGLQMLQPTLGTGITLQERRADDVLVLANRADLLQIFLSLCWNSLEAMGGEGTLTVETRILERALPGLEFRPEQRVAVLSVIDSGIGMDEEITQRVFDPFFTTKNPGQGFGLGLATVRDLVALCGGQVRLTTTPEQGTRFDVYIPALNASALRLNKTAERPAPRARPSRSKNILLVDDDGVIRRTLVRLLRGSGFEVSQSGNIDQALAHIERNPIDLVVLDAKGRGGDGLPIHERFLALQPQIRTIIALSSARSEATAASPLREDLMMLRKPFTFQQLLAAVERLLPG